MNTAQHAKNVKTAMCVWNSYDVVPTENKNRRTTHKQFLRMVLLINIVSFLNNTTSICDYLPTARISLARVLPY